MPYSLEACKLAKPQLHDHKGLTRLPSSLYVLGCRACVR